MQFGRPIGQFQGIKHKLSRMLVALEQARATVWDATRATGSERDSAAAIAGVVAPDAAVQCAKDAIQTFGGIGYTFEHDAHLYFRRALTIRALLGSSADWKERVAGQSLAGVSREMRLDLPEDAEPLREQIRGELAEIVPLEGVEQKRALAARRVRDAPPAAAVGAERLAAGAGADPAGDQGGRAQDAADDHRCVGGALDRRVRHRGPAAALPAAHPQRGTRSGASCSPSPARGPTWPTSR